MTTLPPPNTKLFSDTSLEKQIYSLIDSLSEYLPITNDRNRLSYSLFKFMNGEGDKAEISVKAAKLSITGISESELIKKINDGLTTIKNNLSNN